MVSSCCAPHGACHGYLSRVEEVGKQVIEAIAKVAAFALSVLASIVLCYYHPHFFVLGFAVGVFFHDEVSQRIDKIEHIWNQNLGVKLGLLFFGALTLPMTLSVLSLWMGGKWAVSLAPEASPTR